MEVARVGIKKRRTRGAGEAEASSGTVKRTKLVANDGELTLSPTLIQLRSSVGNAMARSENSTSPRFDDPSSISDYSYVQSQDSDHAACCSSNSSSEFGNESSQNLDPQLPLKSDETVHTSEFNFRGREPSPATELEVESVRFVLASQPLEAATTKMPSESELEEFFSAAEKNIQEQFIQKYNYDIAKDAPLEGRYEWIQMKP